MRDFTPEEKELIINTPITEDCFDIDYEKLPLIEKELTDKICKYLDYFVEPIKCANCKCPIHLSEKEIKERCLYQVSDWTKCLCPSCTDEWKTENGVKHGEQKNLSIL